MNNRILLRAGILCLAGLVPVSGTALEQGDQMFRLGVTTVQPDPGGDDVEVQNGIGEMDVNSDSRPSLAYVHMLRDDVGLEIAGSMPFEHRLHLDEDGGERYSFGTMDMQQFSVAFQYYFDSYADFRPYAGFGFHRSSFSGERIDRNTQANQFDSFSLSPEESWLVNVGVNYILGGDWFLNADLRHHDLSTEARLDGGDEFELELDPLVWTLGVGRRF